MTGAILKTMVAAALAFAFGGPALAAAEHDHGAQHHGGDGAHDAKLELDQGKKWPTDEHLRKGMDNIRAALLANKQIFHGDDDSKTDYTGLASKINAEVAGIVQNCKLEPRADEQLHKVIGQMLSGAEAMEGKAQGVARRAGAQRVAEALGDYARYFDHPGWESF